VVGARADADGEVHAIAGNLPAFLEDAKPQLEPGILSDGLVPVDGGAGHLLDENRLSRVDVDGRVDDAERPGIRPALIGRERRKFLHQVDGDILASGSEVQPARDADNNDRDSNEDRAVATRHELDIILRSYSGTTPRSSCRSRIRYSPYSLLPSAAASRSNCPASIHPLRYAISSGHAIFKPWRRSMVSMNWLGSRRDGGVAVW